MAEASMYVAALVFLRILANEIAEERSEKVNVK